MNKQIRQGVQLHLIPTEKFKTIKIVIRFSAPLNRKEMTARTLLGNVLETSSAKYDTQTKVSEKLAALYGASFGISSSRKGNIHHLSVSMTIVNEKYLAHGSGLLEEACAFLTEMMLFPRAENNQFDEETFQREKDNLREYYLSVNDDKQTLAALRLQELYFTHDETQKIAGYGCAEDLTEVTANQLYETYQKLIHEDMIDIFVIGDLPEECSPLFASIPFAARQTGGYPRFFYERAYENIIHEATDREEIIQGKLNLGYHTGVYYHQADYFPLQIFNGIFGGTPHSKLFMNVREKESMAYYASSSHDYYRGFLSVQTGIDSQNREKVMRLIAEQLNSIQAGDFTQLEMDQTKALLTNQYLLGLDNPNVLIERAYLGVLTPASLLSEEEWCQNVQNVTPEEVVKVAKQVKLQAVYFLEGGQN